MNSERMRALVDNVSIDYDKFINKNVVAAGQRLRRDLLELQKNCKFLRDEIQKMRYIRDDPNVRYLPQFEERKLKVLNGESLEPQRNKKYMEARSRMMKRKKEALKGNKQREIINNDTESFDII